MQDSSLHVCVGATEPEPTEPLCPAAAVDNASRQHRYVSGQYFFEYLVVVSLKKTKDGSSYEPQITYQFPKVSLNVKNKQLCALSKLKLANGRRWLKVQQTP